MSSSSSSIIWIGMDVHKDSVMLAVYVGSSKDPELLEPLPNDLRKLKRFFERWSRRGEIRACYEASGAGYVLHREITAWGYHCDIVAPSLIPVRPGDRRKHDRKDARQIGRLYSAGELVAIRIPSAAEEEVRDLVRCRQTFQREILRSRHYVTKFLARRGFVFRQGTNWTQKHRVWLGALLQNDRLGPQDRSVFSEYLAFHFALYIGRQVAMDDADSAFLRQGDGEVFFRDRVHRRTDQRAVQVDLPRQPRGNIDLVWQNVGITGQE